jgi:hypothetical protein
LTIYSLFLIISIGYSLSRTSPWGFYDLRILNWDDFSNIFGFKNGIWMIVLSLTIFVFVFIIPRFISITPTIFQSFFFSVLIIPLFLTNFWIIFDNFNSSSWTSLKQNVNQLYNSNYCGAIDSELNQKLMKFDINYNLYSGPFEFTLFPCSNFPFPEGGVWPKIDFKVADATVFPSIFELSETPFACSGYSNICINYLQYPIAKFNLFENRTSS